MTGTSIDTTDRGRSGHSTISGIGDWYQEYINMSGRKSRTDVLMVGSVIAI